MSLQKKDLARTAVLEALYKLGNANTGKFFDYERLAEATHLNRGEVVSAANYLIGQGFVDPTFSDKAAALTGRGVVAWEDVLRQQQEEAVDRSSVSGSDSRGTTSNAEIRKDAGRILGALAEFSTGPADARQGRHVLPGSTIQQWLETAQNYPTTPERINDAVKILELSGHVRVLRALGTAPYSFRGVELTPQGRLRYQNSIEVFEFAPRQRRPVSNKDALSPDMPSIS